MSNKTKLLKINQAAALEPYRARIIWEDNSEALINLVGWLNKSKWFAPVIESDAVWRTLHVDDSGWNIQWKGCDMEIPSSTLWRLHQEQTGQAMARQDFVAWLQRHGLTLGRAGKTLGLSRRMVTYYKSGERMIPRTVLLACKAVDAQPELRIE